MKLTLVLVSALLLVLATVTSIEAKPFGVRAKPPAPAGNDIHGSDPDAEKPGEPIDINPAEFDLSEIPLSLHFRGVRSVARDDDEFDIDEDPDWLPEDTQIPDPDETDDTISIGLGSIEEENEQGGEYVDSDIVEVKQGKQRS